MNRPEVLVTGGAGFIGSAVVELLLREKRRVTVLDNFSFGTRKNIPPDVRVIRGDLRNASAVRRAVDRSYEAVFHLAALHYIPYCNEHPSETLSVNVGGTLRLLEVLGRKQPKRLFFASTAAVYDTSSRYHREDEDLFPNDIYGLSKLAGENLVRQFGLRTGVPTAIGRLFNAYGPRETNPHVIPEIVNQLKGGKKTIRLGNLHPFRDYIHVFDTARAIFLLARKASRKTTIANIASGEERSVREILDAIFKLTGSVLRVRTEPRRRRKQERKHLRADLRRLKKLTSFKPQFCFEDGLRQLLVWEGLLPR